MESQRPAVAPISGRPGCRAGPGEPEPSRLPWVRSMPLCSWCSRRAPPIFLVSIESQRPAVAPISGRVEDGTGPGEPDPERRSLHRRPGCGPCRCARGAVSERRPIFPASIERHGQRSPRSPVVLGVEPDPESRSRHGCPGCGPCRCAHGAAGERRRSSWSASRASGQRLPRSPVASRMEPDPESRTRSAGAFPVALVRSMPVCSWCSQ
jgi:hypothetical protein